ncbi:MAG: RsmB/NOP family class I SAM-dependent RNA methyltransferase [Stagnimonas sp.]|nr:RsmB/NOP family class I SAM-dependent RNA methyltransferase [Stagnimonas sp.]
MTAALPRRLHALRARDALQDIARGSKPADQILEALFRSHKQMGKRDRASVGDLVYGVLRDVGRLQALAGAAPVDWLARHLADAGHEAAAITALDLPPPAADGAVATHAALNLPQDLHSRLLTQIGEAETAALAAALNRPAPTDVRVNTLKATRDEVRAALVAQGVAAEPTPFSPVGLRLSARLSKQSTLLLDGEIEPQDEGSQLLAQLAGAQPGETVIDWCAGVGGKALAMAAAMQDNGRLIACDISASRLAKLPPRAARAGIGCIETRTHGVDDLSGIVADMVLVDAPCSGTGTLRRSPELRLRVFDYASLAALQLQILDEAARCVRAGGRLIYATCSLLAEENEDVVARFLAANTGFEPRQPQGFDTQLVDARSRLRLWPHRHGTDGFFAQVLVRTA